MMTAPLLAAVLMLTACGEAQQEEQAHNNRERPIDYRNDTCDYCQNEIRTERYGGRLTTEDGEEYIFRSAECLAGFYLDRSEGDPDVASLEVVDFIDGFRMIDVEEATYLFSINLPSPNGMDLTAMDRTNEDMIRKIEAAYPGTFADWEEVLARVGPRRDMIRNAGSAAAGNTDSESSERGGGDS